MDNAILLLEQKKQNRTVKVKIKKGYAVYDKKWSVFGVRAIKDIINFVNSLHKQYNFIPLPISFELGEIRFCDKLTYVLFEIICSILISEYKHNVYVKFNNSDTILTKGIESSPLLLLTTGEKEHIKKFEKKFEKEYYKNHYRRLLSLEDMEGDCLCKIMDEIAYFLNFFQIKEEFISEISEVIIELIGNVKEHAKTDCLVDIDVAPGYKKLNDDRSFYGLNIVVVNFSKEFFYSPLRRRLFDTELELNERHQKVFQAYCKHLSFFDGNYVEEDFFNIASFQHKISGNIDKSVTGGTGLTKLICSLEKSSDLHHCYMVSGNRQLLFLHEYMEYNEDKWIGFNEEKDFLNKKPNLRNCHKNEIIIPGTAYNLNFVMEGSN